jgi:hypothetical protein
VWDPQQYGPEHAPEQLAAEVVKVHALSYVHDIVNIRYFVNIYRDQPE